MAIEYKINNGIEYAMISKSFRENGRIRKSKRINLGRVIDKEKGIYKNRERGIFHYDPKTNEYSKVSADYIEPVIKRKKKYRDREILNIAFGSVYFFNEYLSKLDFWAVMDAMLYRNADTLHALLAYYCISPYSNRHAIVWWNYTYARVLYPNAQLSSQRISETLEDIGSEEAKQLFFKAYYKFLQTPRHKGHKKKPVFPEIDEGTAGEGILIDSTGLPNAIRIPVTAVNNHNGVVSEEVRLIYVVQQNTGLPLFFRYVAGNIIDATTIKTTVAELKAYGIKTKYAILDAGYYNGKNADILIDAGISFISRMNSNFSVYQDAVRDHRSSLESRENLTVFHSRFVYIKCIECNIGDKKNRPAYAYLCLDCTMKREEEYHLSQRVTDVDLSTDDIHKQRSQHGIFMLVSTRRIAKENLLKLYYTRNQIEDIFKLCKGNCKILPINIEKEATLRGHLLITFAASIVMKLLSDELDGTNLTAEALFMHLNYHRANIYDNEIVASEVTKIMRFIYNRFKIAIPTEIEYSCPNEMAGAINEVGAELISGSVDTKKLGN